MLEKVLSWNKNCPPMSLREQLDAQSPFYKIFLNSGQNKLILLSQKTIGYADKI